MSATTHHPELRASFELDAEERTLIAHLDHRFTIELTGIQARGQPTTFIPRSLRVYDQVTKSDISRYLLDAEKPVES